MSTGLECDFICLAADPAPEWFYILENYNSPKMAWDWYDYATAYGPFNSLDSAEAHLRRHHANPGGASIDETPRKAVRAVLADLITDARKRGLKRR